MAKFSRKHQLQSQSINTASLPDIVFMLLFFFMVVTKMKSNEIKVVVNPPSASEAAVLENKQVTTYLYIGKPVRSDIYGSATRLQLNDAFKDPSEIQAWVQEEKRRIPAHQIKIQLHLNNGLSKQSPFQQPLGPESQPKAPYEYADLNQPLAHQTELFTVSIKADKDTKMGILTQVKQSLRDADALKIVYSANKGKSLSTK